MPTAELSLPIKPENYIHTTFQRRLTTREQEAGILPVEALTTPEAVGEQFDRLESMIGNTPLLGLWQPNNSLILMKMESQNPTESHYDRVYIKTLRKLYDEGKIKPGDELYEVTSGSAGTSFAWLCSRLGFKTNIYVPALLPQARKQEMINFGANLIEVSEKVIKEDDETGEITEKELAYVPEASRRMVVEFNRNARTKLGVKAEPCNTDDFHIFVAKGENHSMVLVNHSANPITPRSLEAIGEEVREVIPRGVGIDYFVSTLGNGSSTTGVTAGLRRGFPRVSVIGVEDVDNPVQFEAKFGTQRYIDDYGHLPPYKPQKMFGSSARGTRLSFMDVTMLDDIQLVPDTEWEERMRRYNAPLAEVETIGASSAGALVVAERLAQKYGASIIFTIAYDKSGRYGEPLEAWTPPVKIAPIHPVFERPSIQPLGWKQRAAENPVDIPVNLPQSYRSSHWVRIENSRI